MSAAPPEPLVARRPIPSSLLDPDALKVVHRLVRYGHQAYLVGGCVRDLLLGFQPKDFDVATSARPPELRKLFRNCRIIGRRFRLAHMLFREGKIIEVATFRREPEHEEPEDEEAAEDEVQLLRQDNVYGEPHEDALRRDFTINGLFYDVAPGSIIDYVGGLADVERRLLRTIGEPEVRLQEDPVRILRALKFAARQDLGIDPALYEAAVRHRGLLSRSAPPRVLEELFRLLRGGSSHRSFWLAREMGVLAEVLPELDRHLVRAAPGSRRTWRALQAVDSIVRSGRMPSDPVLLAALLLAPLEARTGARRDTARATDEAIGPMAERLVVPRKARDRLRHLLVAQRRLSEPEQVRRARLAAREHYAEAVDLYEIRLRADGASPAEVAAWRAGLPAPTFEPAAQPFRRGLRRRR